MATELDLTKIGLIIEFAEKGLGTLNCETELHTSYLLEEGNRVDITVKSVSYSKKIYEPSSMTVILQLIPVEDSSIGKIVSLARKFASAKVHAYRGEITNLIAENFFVFKSTPTHERDNSVTVTLDLFSMDKLLDIKTYSRANVGRKLRGEILEDAVARCAHNNLVVSVADDDELQFMRWYSDKKQIEFIQPYIVQYNETPYSMLRRTANRCGEFLFFEDGKLHLGLPKYKKENSTDEVIYEVGNEDNRIHFLSISYSETVTADISKDQNFYSDNYCKKDENVGDSKMLRAGGDTFISNLSRMRNAITDTDKQTVIDGYIDIYKQNRLYYDIYDNAHSAYYRTGIYQQSLNKEKNKKQEICGDTTDTESEAPTQKAVRAAAPDYLKSRLDDKNGEIEKERQELKRLEKLFKEYVELEADFNKLKEEYFADSTNETKETAYYEKKADLNLFTGKNGNGTIIKAKSEDCLGKISMLEKDIRYLTNNYKVVIDPDSTDAQKDNAIEKSTYFDAIYLMLSDQVRKINENIEEIKSAMEKLKNEPSKFTPYKEKNIWKNYVEWKEFCDYTQIKITEGTEEIVTTKGQQKLDAIWTNILKKGKELFPISIDDSAKFIKEIAESIKAGNYCVLTSDYYLGSKDDEKKKPNTFFEGILDEIIQYCKAIIANKSNQNDSPDEAKSLYDFEYGNDEYLATYKMDETGGYGDVFFNACCQGTNGWARLFSKIVPFLAGFFTSPGRPAPALGAAAFSTFGLPNVYTWKLLALLHDHYNEKFISNYTINGKEVKNSEYGDSEEVALFTTYNKTTGLKGYGLDKALASLFYQEVWKQEQMLSDEKISITIDTAKNSILPKLGSKIKYEDKIYIVTSICGERNGDQESALASSEIIEAIPLAEGDLCVPPAIEYDRYLKADPQTAKIVDDDDPKFLGRVRIRYKWQNDNDEPSPWIRVSTPYASKGGGFFFLPHKGDNVMIGYEHGNVERPFVNSSLFNKEITPPTPISKKKARQVISSQYGHSIKFVDKSVGGMGLGLISNMDPLLDYVGGLGKDWLKENNPGGGIILSDTFGFYKIACSADKRTVSIASPLGKVSVNAFTGITLSAPNGNITIEGKNVEIKAGNEVKITSGLNVKNAYNKAKPEVPFTLFAEAASGVIGAVGNLIPKTLDLSLFRHMYERVLPPISGALQIKSYRFVLIDSGLKDFAAKGIKANHSLYAHLKKWQGFKVGDFQKGVDKNPEKYGLTAHNIVEMWRQSLSNGLVSIARSLIPEKNIWRVDSDENAVIIAGSGYRTNADKTKIAKVDGIQPMDGDNVLESPSLYSEEVDKKTSKPWDYAAKEYDYTAAEANQEGEETKVMSGFKTVMHAVSHFVFSVSTLGIYSLLRSVQWGIRRRIEKKYENLTPAAKAFYDTNPSHRNDPLTVEKFLKMSDAEREELINYGKNHNNAEEVHLSEEIEIKAAVDGSEKKNDEDVARLINSIEEIKREEEP